MANKTIPAIQVKDTNVGIGTTDPAVKLSVSGVTSTGDRKLSLGVLDINVDNASQIRINTKIPLNSGGADFTVNIKGFRYGAIQMVSLSIGWHYYLGSFFNETAISNGAWNPTITLAQDANGFVVIYLPAPAYWAKLYVESVYTSNYGDIYSSGWTWTDADLSDCTNLEVAPYKALATDITGNSGSTSAISGTTNYIPKFTGSGTTIGNSAIYDNGGNIGIGITNADYPLTVDSINIGGAGANLGLILNSVINTAIPASSVKAIIGVTNNGFGYAAGSLLIQPRTGVNAATVFTTEGTEKMRIESGGNILFKGSATGYAGANLVNDNSALAIYATEGAGTTKDIFFQSGGSVGSPRTTIKANGNIGVNTDTPTEKLDVRGVIRVSNSGVNDSGILAFGNFANGTGYYDNGIFRGAVNNITTSGNYLNIGSYDGLVFTTSNAALGSQAIRMFVNGANGYVGIGNTNPLSKLNATNTYYSGTPTKANSAAFFDNQGVGLYMGGNEYSYGYIQAEQSDNTNIKSLVLQPNSGSVGISTVPETKLHVNGNITVPFTHTYNAEGSYARKAIMATGYASGFDYLTLQAPGSSTSRILLSADLIGIGTTNPAYRLDVAGRALVDQFQYTKAIGYAGNDLNSLVTAGFYDGSGMTNAPNSGWFYVTVETHVGGTDWVHQTATSFGASNSPNEVYTRVRVGGTWGAWKQLGDAASISGTTNYVSKFTSGTTIGNSQIFDDGTSVGINTTSPAARLSVVQDITTTAEFGSFGQFTLQGATNSAKLLSFGFNTFTDAGFIQAMINGVSYNNLLLNARGGNVGIGTTSPAAKLEVAGRIATTGGTNNDVLSQYVTLKDITSTNDYALRYQNSSGSQIGYIGVISSANKFTYQNANGHIFSGGNVGIGTTNPSEKLTVSGKIYANPNLPVVISGQGAPYYGTNITLASDTGTTQGANRIWSRYDGTGSGAITFERSTSVQAYNSDPQLLSYTESMRIAGNGNVGIGTTNPTTKLQVYSTENGNWTTSFENGSVGGHQIYTGYNNGTSRYGVYIQGGGNDANSYDLLVSGNKFAVVGNGNVGIGITSPTKVLSLKRASICGIELDDSSAVTDIQSVGGRFIIDTPSQAYVNISSNNQFYVDGTSVGVHTAAPDPSAALDVTSTTQGFLPPRMSDTEMNSIAAPAAGLIVWNYDSGTLYVFDGSNWRKIAYA